MRVLVTGRAGQLARALAHAAPDGIALSLHGRDTLDLAVPGAAAMAIAAARPDLVINAAAYTAVDQAESESEAAHRLNAEAPGEIAAACAEAGAALIHISTDYVFDGASARPYREDDPTAPTGVYGASKLAGEAAVRAANPRSVVLRTAWVFSPWGKNFVLTMLRLAETRPELGIVDDQHGNPTSALDIAEACLAIAPRLVAAPADDPVWGAYHYAGCGTCTWADFAEAVFAEAGPRIGGKVPKVNRIGTKDYPTPARRPANSALDCGKFERTFGVATVPWREALKRVIGMIEEEGRA